MERSNQNGLWLTELVSLFVDQSGVKPNTNRNLLACVFPALGSRRHEFLLQGSEFFICFFGGCWDWSELSIKLLRFYRFFFTAGCVFLKAMNRSACLLSFLNLLTFYPSQNNHLKDIWHILHFFRRINEEDASSLAFDGERWNSLHDQWPRELHTRFTILTWGSSGGIVKLCLLQSWRQSRNCYHFVAFRNLIALWFSLTCKTLSGLG